MAPLAALRKEAKELGMSRDEILAASSSVELAKAIDHFKNPASEAPKRATKKRRGTVAKKKVAATPARKKSAAKSVPAAKSTSGNAKRKTTGSGSNGKVASSSTAKGARNLLDGVNYSLTDGWNARKDSAPDRIIAALRKARGNREKAFVALAPDVWKYVGKTFRNGQKRTKADAEAMLRYRISRTAWDFALHTGQHEKAGNRVEYGTGGTGQGVWKPAKKVAAARKAAPAARKTTARKTTARKAKTTAARKTTARKTGVARKTVTRRK